MQEKATDDQVEEIEELFEQNDTDGNGEIDFAEFAALVAELDEPQSQEALALGFREIDTNHDGRIDLAEFLDWWMED